MLNSESIEKISNEKSEVTRLLKKKLAKPRRYDDSRKHYPLTHCKVREGVNKKRPVFVVFDYEGGGGVGGNVKRLQSYFISYAFFGCKIHVLSFTSLSIIVRNLRSKR